MNIGIVGGGINGLCCAWLLSQQGHQVHLYERNTLMGATSRSSSKLLHGGLRYLENGEFRLVRESLHERDAWIRRVPDLAKPLRLVLPVYTSSRRPGWMMGIGLFLYDILAGKSLLPKAKRLTVTEIIERDPELHRQGLTGGFEFFDGQMDDYALGNWVATQARAQGATLLENTGVHTITPEGKLATTHAETHLHDRILNIAGPWAQQLLQDSGIAIPYQLDLVRGSHIVLNQQCPQAYLLEVPNERRIVFVLPWKGQTIVGTTEVRQSLEQPIICSDAERDYLLRCYQHYFPEKRVEIIESFSGVRPLLFSATDPNKASREYLIHRTGNIVTVLGGKWTTSMALAEKAIQALH